MFRKASMYKEKLFTKPPFSDRLLRSERGAPFKIEDHKGDFRYIYADGRVDWHSNANNCQSSVEITELATSRTGEVQFREAKNTNEGAMCAQRIGNIATATARVS